MPSTTPPLPRSPAGPDLCPEALRRPEQHCLQLQEVIFNAVVLLLHPLPLKAQLVHHRPAESPPLKPKLKRPILGAANSTESGASGGGDDNTRMPTGGGSSPPTLGLLMTQRPPPQKIGWSLQILGKSPPEVCQTPKGQKKTS